MDSGCLRHRRAALRGARGFSYGRRIGGKYGRGRGSRLPGSSWSGIRRCRNDSGLFGFIRTPFSRTCIGLAGLSIEAVREWAEREISKAVGGELLIAGDEEIALDGAFRGGPGILIIAGTGSNVLGRAAARDLKRGEPLAWDQITS